MNIALGCDHAGFELKSIIAQYLWENSIVPFDCGCDGDVCDYPDIAKSVCKRIQTNKSDVGILICGTGIGMSMAANKCDGIRAAVCTEPLSAKFTRMHNNANVLCLGSRIVGPIMAKEIVDTFLNTQFDGGLHAVRVEKMMDIERLGKK